MQALPLFGLGVQSYSNAVTAQRRLNCIYEVRDDDDKNKLILRGTPGTINFTTLPNGTVRGWRVVKNVLYAVSGNQLFSISVNGSTTFLGNIGTKSGYCTLSDNGVQVIIVDGTAGYIYTISSNTLSKITDANFPNGCYTVTFAGGLFIVEQPGTLQFWMSNSYDGTTWTPIVFASKETNPDNIVAVDSMMDTLVIFGNTTTEFWQNVGGYPLLFQRVSGTVQNWGLAALYSRAKFSNSIAFLATNTQGQVQVVMFNGYATQRISNHDIENIINGFTTISDAIGYSYVFDGHMIYQLTFPSMNRTFIYDGITGFWSEAQTGTATTGRHFGNLGITYNGKNYISDYSSNGNIYQISETSYTDAGTPIKRLVQSKHIRLTGNEFALAEVFFDMDVGLGLQSGQGSSPKVMLQISKDGGMTFGSERTVNIGSIGTYQARAIFRRLGSAKDFVLRLSMTDPVPFTVTEACGLIPARYKT
jgi:Phage stabilisation protein